jgi:hypothetical protein
VAGWCKARLSIRPFGTNAGSALSAHGRVLRQRTPSRNRMHRTWLRPTSTPISRGLGERVQGPIGGLRLILGLEAAELLGYFGGAQSPPTQRDDSSPEDTITRCVAASCEFTDLALHFGIFGHSSAEQLRHGLASSSMSLQRLYSAGSWHATPILS